MTDLSVLDLSLVTSGTPPSKALRNSIDLAQHVDALGYSRYWTAEHHNLASVASPAPDLHDRPGRGRDEAHPRRLRRRDAAEPRAAGGRRALQDAGGAVSRPHRSRARPRAGHRSGHGLRAARKARRPQRRRIPRTADGTDAVGDAQFPRRPSVQQRSRHAVGRAAAADLAARLVRLQRRPVRADRHGLRVRASLCVV